MKVSAAKIQIFLQPAKSVTQKKVILQYCILHSLFGSREEECVKICIIFYIIY